MVFPQGTNGYKYERDMLVILCELSKKLGIDRVSQIRSQMQETWINPKMLPLLIHAKKDCT